MQLNTWLKYVVIGGIFLIPLTPLVVSSSLLFPYISGKALLFRFIVGIILLAWLFLATRDRQFWPQRSLISWAMLAFVSVLSLATVVSINPERSFWSNFERMEGLVTYWYLGAYFLVLISVFKDRTWWRRLFQFSLIISGVVCLLALKEVWGAMMAGQAIRVDATLGNPIYLAVYTLIHLFMAGWLWFTSEKKQKYVTVLYALIGLLELAVLYFTATRGAAFGLIGGSVLTAVILIIKTTGRTRRFAAGYLILLAVVGGGFLSVRHTAWVQESPILSRYANISFTEGTVESRLLIWQVAWPGFLENPILGWGPDNFGIPFNKYYDPTLWTQEQWFDRSHNVFFDWAINAGVLGLLSYLSLFAAALYSLRRQRVEEIAIFSGLLLAYFIHNVFVFDHLVSYILFFTLLGYWHFTSQSHSVPRKESVIKLSSGLLVLLVIIAVLMWGVIFYHSQYRPYMAGRNIISALSPMNGPADEVLAARANYFGRAVGYGPFGRTEAREQLLSLALNLQLDPNLAPGASAEIKSQFAALAADQMLEEIKVNSVDVRPRYLLANFYATLGLYKEAKPLFESARELAPTKTGLLAELAWTYLNAGEVKRGMDLASAIHAELPAQPVAAQVYALGLARQGDTAGATRVINETIAANPGFKVEGEKFLSDLRAGRLPR